MLPLRRFRLACIASAALIIPSHAQETATIHVYTDRVQIPVLVLGAHREELPRLKAEQFHVGLDGVGTMRAAVRSEANDPLEVSVLLDASDGDNLLLAQLPGLAQTLVDKSLAPGDHLSVYAMDGCKLRRFRPMDVVDGPDITAALKEALAFPPWPLTKKGPPCPAPAGLWDVLYYLSGSMDGLPGRRIILAVTNGAVKRSARSADSVRTRANRSGTSIFAVAEKGRVPNGAVMILSKSIFQDENPELATVSELSGGLVMETVPAQLPETLSTVFHMIRNRYVLEFPRPAGMTGAHTIDVSILSNSHAFVRPGGLSFPAVPHRDVADVQAAAVKPPDPPPTEQPSGQPAATPPAVADAPSTPASPAPSAPVVAPAVGAAATPVVPVDPLDITDEVQAASTPHP